MRKTLAATIFGAFLALYPAFGQVSPNVNYVHFNGVPSGSCSPIMQAIDDTTGKFYTCLAGSWFLAGGGAGGPGGSNTQIQWNNASAFGGISGWITNGTDTVTGTTLNVLTSNGVTKADQEAGADSGAKISACLTAASLTNSKICDARGVATGAITSTIAIPANVTLILPAKTLTSTVIPAITLANYSQLYGSYAPTGSTEIVGPAGVAGGVIQSVAGGSQYCRMSGIRLTGNSPVSADGTIGFDLERFHSCHFSDLSEAAFDVGMILGDTSAGNASYYNTFDNLSLINNYSYSLNIKRFAAVNTFGTLLLHGGSVNPTSSNTFMRVNGYANTFNAPFDCEASASGATCAEIGPLAYSNHFPGGFYIEGLNIGIKWDSGAASNVMAQGMGTSVNTAVNTSGLVAADFYKNEFPVGFSNTVTASIPFYHFPAKYFDLNASGGLQYFTIGGTDFTSAIYKQGVTFNYGANAASSMTGYSAITVGNVVQQTKSYTLTNGANGSLSLINGNQSIGVYWLTGPTGAFSISGFTPATGTNSESRDIWLLYTGTQVCTFLNQDAGTTASNRILTLTGSDLAVKGPFAIHFVYDRTAGSNATWDMATVRNTATIVPSEVDSNIITGSSGAWTAGTALPDGITATTQSAGDNSTKVATTAYADTAAGLTLSNCASAASPAVCGSAAAGHFVIAAGATTVTVNTTAVTANSEIFVDEDESVGGLLSVTCNTGISGQPTITARVAATSFSVDIPASLATNPVCFGYHIVN